MTLNGMGAIWDLKKHEKYLSVSKLCLTMIDCHRYVICVVQQVPVFLRSAPHTDSQNKFS